jgi:hypothetical protein
MLIEGKAFFFLKNQEPEAPTAKDLYLNSFTKGRSRVTEVQSCRATGVSGDRERKKKNQSFYRKEFIHDSNRGTELAFVLCKRRRDSVKIYLWQLATEGFKFLKMTSFLTVQIPQQKRMNKSRENFTSIIDFQA